VRRINPPPPIRCKAGHEYRVHAAMITDRLRIVQLGFASPKLSRLPASLSTR
jgi:hypothetical protein